MRGLELSRRYFDEVAGPLYRTAAPRDFESMAFGLAGPGSECLGFDDEVSRDHDWGPRVCIWVPEALYRECGEPLQRLYASLDGTFRGYGPVSRLETRFPRDGVISIPRFFRAYLGTERLPETIRDWLLLPEEALSMCTNGAVFLDGPGEFSTFRRGLLAYYPRDLWFRKIASRCKSISRDGQYNLGRALRRGDRLAAYHHTAEFAYGAAVLSYLLHRTYRPFGKWVFRGLQGLGERAAALYRELDALLAVHPTGPNSGALEIVERCAEILVDEIEQNDLIPVARSQRDATYLYAYGERLEHEIVDDDLRESPRLNSVGKG